MTHPYVAMTFLHSSRYTQVVEVGGLGGFWGRFSSKENPSYDPQNPKKGSQYVRHHKLSRAEIKLYSVKVLTAHVSLLPLFSWGECKCECECGNGGGGAHCSLLNYMCVKVVTVKLPPLADGEKPRSYLRVHTSSLQRLAELYPAEYPVPAVLPASHGEDVEHGDTGQGGVEHDDADSDGGGSGDEHDDDPELVRIPAGYVRAPAAACFSTVAFFMLWARVGGAVARWHFGQITKVFPAGYTHRRSPFTHDAKLKGDTYGRGVNLTQQQQKDGYWVHLVVDSQAPASSSAIVPNPPTPAPRGVQRASRARAKVA